MDRDFCGPPQKPCFGRVICLTQGKEAAFDNVRLHEIAPQMPLGLQLKATDFPIRGARVSGVARDHTRQYYCAASPHAGNGRGQCGFS